MNKSVLRSFPEPLVLSRSRRVLAAKRWQAGCAGRARAATEDRPRTTGDRGSVLVARGSLVDRSSTQLAHSLAYLQTVLPVRAQRHLQTAPHVGGRIQTVPPVGGRLRTAPLVPPVRAKPQPSQRIRLPPFRTRLDQHLVVVAVLGAVHVLLPGEGELARTFVRAHSAGRRHTRRVYILPVAL